MKPIVLTLSFLLAILCLAPSASAQATKPTTLPAEPFTVGDEGRQFNSADARGQFLAIHFLLTTECPYCSRLINEYTRNAPTLAGIRQIFVKPDSLEAFDAMLKGLPDGDKLPIYRDADSKLVEKSKFDGGYKFHGQVMHYPAVIILNETGKEVFRHIGKSNADRLPFASYAAKVAELTTDAETRQANLDGKLALQGYDPVEYLNNYKAVVGDKSIESAFRGITYRFSTADNRLKFNAEPTKYLPAYGGWCASAIAKGDKVEIDPKSFKVSNGRTFLFYKGIWGDALKDWNKDEAGLTTKASDHWKSLVSKP